MNKQIPHPDPSLYQDGDFVYCDGTDAFSSITRIVTGHDSLPWWKRVRDHSIPTHVGNIWTVGGQHFIAEMRPNGLEANSPMFYRVPFGQKKRSIIAVLRCPALNDYHRSQLKQQIALDIRRGMEYSIKDLTRFVFHKVKEDRNRMYCSEYSYQLFVNDRGQFNDAKAYDPFLRSSTLDNMVSPAALYENQLLRYQVVWRRS